MSLRILFIERAFAELNPQTQFFSNWHIEKIAQELEDCLSCVTRFRGRDMEENLAVPPAECPVCGNTIIQG